MHVRVLWWLNVTDREGLIRPYGKRMVKRHEVKGDGGPRSRRSVETRAQGGLLLRLVYGERAD